MRVIISAQAAKFIKGQEVTVLSTLSRDGQVQGATVYYRFADDKFYILTKSDSSKAHNMLANHQVALTIYDSQQIKTVQLQGLAEIESDLTTKTWLFEQLAQPRRYEGEELMPPVTHLHAGGFIAFRITPFNFFFTDYKDTARIIPRNYPGPLV